MKKECIACEVFSFISWMPLFFSVLTIFFLWLVAHTNYAGHVHRPPAAYAGYAWLFVPVSVFLLANFFLILSWFVCGFFAWKQKDVKVNLLLNFAKYALGYIIFFAIEYIEPGTIYWLSL